MKLSLRWKAMVVLIPLLIILSFFVGYGYGFAQGGEAVIEYVFKVAVELKRLGLIDVDISKEFLNAAVFQYDNRVGGCLFIQNRTL